MHVLFRIITQKPIELDLPFDVMTKYPVHEHYLVEGTEKIYIYKFDPTRTTKAKINEYIDVLKEHFKKIHNAYSVEAGELQLQLEKQS